MDSRLEAGGEVIQAYYTVLNPGGSALSSLRASALAAIHYVRPLGRAALGLSAGLKGNGMCFSAELMRRVGWRWFTLAEDVEFHLALVEAGGRVHFAPETRVLGDMPVTFAQAESQNARWERGRLYVLRTQVPRLLVQGVRLRSAVRLDAAVEQLIPPLSVPLCGALVAAGGGVALDMPIVTAIGLASVGAYGVHVLIAMVLTRAPARAYAAFALAPPYVLWKLVVYLRAMTRARLTDWVRTSRSS
jgi:cellulose synthase/poly-beta-1,6-N-acetylglucosamine synthase-like glycosyltransferase